MFDYYRSYATRPESQDYLRRANEARAAAWYGAFEVLVKGAAAGLRGVGALGRAYQDWRRTRAAIRHLSALDDRMLADIGLSRHDISETVAAWSGSPHTTLQELVAQVRPHRRREEPVRKRTRAALRDAANENAPGTRVLPPAA
ncbi:MAG: DUF1127 domain-containing protein [Kiloniellales bacterium]|nr:DUF1127 domain-containing protein [Kiloniellales bacterium]